MDAAPVIKGVSRRTPTTALKRMREKTSHSDVPKLLNKSSTVRFDDDVSTVRIILTKEKWIRLGKWEKHAWNLPWRPVVRSPSTASEKSSDPVADRTRDGWLQMREAEAKA